METPPLARFAPSCTPPYLEMYCCSHIVAGSKSWGSNTGIGEVLQEIAYCGSRR